MKDIVIQTQVAIDEGEGKIKQSAPPLEHKHKLFPGTCLPSYGVSSHSRTSVEEIGQGQVMIPNATFFCNASFTPIRPWTNRGTSRNSLPAGTVACFGSYQRQGKLTREPHSFWPLRVTTTSHLPTSILAKHTRLHRRQDWAGLNSSCGFQLGKGGMFIPNHLIAEVIITHRRRLSSARLPPAREVHHQAS